MSSEMIAFGPVPSRRLGRSLGINNIPPKICSYACVYCQLGRTIKMQVERQSFYQPEEIVAVVREKVQNARARVESIDYLTFVPDGEPTLDLHLGEAILGLRDLGIKIAVISNASLFWMEQVRAELKQADWVSLKVDAVHQPAWRRIDRPHGSLDLERIQDGMLAFAREYEGELVTETMLIQGVNDSEQDLLGLADFLSELRPSIAYLSIPTRPPAEAWVQPAEEKKINLAYQWLRDRVAGVELLLGYEGNEFASTGNARDDLLSITAVHPMREDAVREFLTRAGESWDLIDALLEQDVLVMAQYDGKRFYLRKIAAVKADDH